MPQGKIFAAIEGFSSDSQGVPRNIQQGETFREGHPIVQSHPGAFKEWQIDNEVEQATAAPGEKRNKPAAKKAAKAKAADEKRD